MTQKIRADVLLCNQNLAESRSKAQDFIAEGLAWYKEQGQWKQIVKANQQLDEQVELKIQIGQANKFVSRGGLKLQYALEQSGMQVADEICLDLGQSTGGFTDCLLKNGAKKVVGLDVGHDQLHESLKNNSQVIYFEKTNLREFQINTQFIAHIPVGGFRRVVADLSFISLASVLSEIAQLTVQGGELLLLVKPQFEVGAKNLSRGGIVKNLKSIEELQGKIKSQCETVGIQVKIYFASGIEGRDGNQEYFIFGQKI